MDVVTLILAICALLASAGIGIGQIHATNANNPVIILNQDGKVTHVEVVKDNKPLKCKEYIYIQKQDKKEIKLDKAKEGKEKSIIELNSNIIDNTTLPKAKIIKTPIVP